MTRADYLNTFEFLDALAANLKKKLNLSWLGQDSGSKLWFHQRKHIISVTVWMREKLIVCWLFSVWQFTVSRTVVSFAVGYCILLYVGLWNKRVDFKGQSFCYVWCKFIYGVWCRHQVGCEWKLFFLFVSYSLFHLFFFVYGVFVVVETCTSLEGKVWKYTTQKERWVTGSLACCFTTAAWLFHLAFLHFCGGTSCASVSAHTHPKQGFHVQLMFLVWHASPVMESTTN